MEKNSTQLVQAMPLLEGKTNLATGTYTVIELIHCATDGSVTVIWDTGATDVIDMVAGQDFAFSGDITIGAGTFHIS